MHNLNSDDDEVLDTEAVVAAAANALNCSNSIMTMISNKNKSQHQLQQENASKSTMPTTVDEKPRKNNFKKIGMEDEEQERLR